MNIITQLPWAEPLVVAAHCKISPMALLYSGTTHAHTGRYSYLAIGAKATIASSDSTPLQTTLSNTQAWHENFWVGWLGYGLKNELEKLPADTPTIIEAPNVGLFKPDTIYRFDHQQKCVDCVGPHQLAEHWESAAPPLQKPPRTKSLHSNMSDVEYMQHVNFLVQEITKGSLYQANLTRKFYGEFASIADGFALFRLLCAESPAAYSAYIRLLDIEVISSSPEQFLSITPHKKISSRPIKGTMSRADNPKQDAERMLALKTSEKDKAENLMIVDLMRHDFSRVCAIGSVEVEALFDITTHAHIHHMSSSITGLVNEKFSTLSAALACFPPGSMTGAPKIRAMQLCSALEKQNRGIYSGAIGWFGGDGSAELSVVIRTLILQGKQFEFQAGGGIVADSDPTKELAEMFAKTKGICRAFNFDLTTLKI